MNIEQENHSERRRYSVVIGFTDQAYKGNYEFDIKNKMDIRKLYKFVGGLGIKPGSRVGFNVSGYHTDHPIHNIDTYFCDLNSISEEDEELFVKIENNEIIPDQETFSRYLDYIRQLLVYDQTLILTKDNLIEPFKKFYEDFSEYFYIDEMIYQELELVFRGIVKE